MENFDRENIDELLEIRQIRQYFPPSKICAVRYSFYFIFYALMQVKVLQSNNIIMITLLCKQ